jgi:DNA modification methylase
MSSYTLHLGDCLEVLPEIPDASVDAIFTDPPYPYIKRDYGYWTEETWLPMMQEVVRQSRRILKPHGSIVMVLQPNSEKVGKMRPWLWKFMVWCCEEWGIVQDAYWWNYTTLSNGICIPRERGLMRPSVKPCVWIGNPSCYRNQDAVLWEISKDVLARKSIERFRRSYPSGQGVNQKRSIDKTIERGGSIAYNLLPVRGVSASESEGHGSQTPLELTDWWLRYISKPGDTVLDMFSGTGTTGVAALKLGRKYIGIEKMEKYHPIAQTRLGEAEGELIARERQPYLMGEVPA